MTRVVVVHDYLTQRGGAERVVLAMLAAFPGARVVTSIYEPALTFPEFAGHEVEALLPAWTPLVRRDTRLALPVLATVFGRHTIADADVVLCSSSGWAHGVGSTAPKVVYCHTPARWLYRPDDYWLRHPDDYARGQPLAARVALRLVRAPLTRWDRRAAASADCYLANSSVIAERIRRVYGATARVLHPPPGIDAGGARREVAGVEPGFLLTVARNRSYKNTAAVEAAARSAGARLVVVGGSRTDDADGVTRLANVADEELRWLYAHCDALVAAAYEDFGLTPVEAMGFGKPVLALRAGGYLDSVVDGVTGAFFDRAEPASIAETIRAFDAGAFDAEVIARHAGTFGRDRFADGLREVVLDVAERPRSRAPRVQRRPRVLFVDHVARLSGGELALLSLLTALDGRVDAHVVLGEDGPLVERIRRLGVPVEIVPLYPRVRDLRRDRAVRAVRRPTVVWETTEAVTRLLRAIGRVRPDIVHTNSLKASLYGGLAGRLARVPVLWHVRDRIAPDYLPPATVRLVRLASRLLPSAVIANSQTTLATLPWFRDGSVVYNAFIPPPELRSQVARGRTTVPTIGVVGRLTPWKGQHVFLHAFASAFRGEPAQARVIGGALFGDEAYERSLLRLARELGVESQVEFRGFREDIWAELAELDVLVHCSVVPEPFGQVVLEGMAAGLAVVAADAGGPTEIARNGVDALLVPPNDPTALAGALRSLVDDPALRARLGDAAREAVGRFSPDEAAARVLEVYGSLLR